MRPWRKKKALLRGAKFQTVLEPMEREVLGNLTSTVSEAVIQLGQTATKAELAAMMDRPSSDRDATEDPSLAGLFQDYFAEGEEEYDGDARVVRSLHENEVATEKPRTLQVISHPLG